MGNSWEPTTVNAHPQVNQTKKIAVVHNGIIENFFDLRNELREDGFVFVSETDTEVIPHLVVKYKNQERSLEEAFYLSLLK